MRPLPDGMREKVLAAAELFAEFGLDATKMEDVAAATGVPKATLYYYFDGKEDILAFLFSEILDEVARAIDEAVQADGTAAERLRLAIVAHLRVFEEFPAASRALQFDLGRAARVPEIAARTDVAVVQPICDLLIEGAAEGSLRRVDHPRLVAVAILGAVSTTGINALSIQPRRPARRIASDVISFIFTGVAP